MSCRCSLPLALASDPLVFSILFFADVCFTRLHKHIPTPAKFDMVSLVYLYYYVYMDRIKDIKKVVSNRYVACVRLPASPVLIQIELVFLFFILFCSAIQGSNDTLIVYVYAYILHVFITGKEDYITV